MYMSGCIMYVCICIHVCMYGVCMYVCVCVYVSHCMQDERHALLECPLTANIRQKFKITDREDIHDIFRRDGPELCDIIQQTLYKYRYL